MTPLSVNVDQATLIFPGLSKRDRAHVKWNVICFNNMIVREQPGEGHKSLRGESRGVIWGGGGWGAVPRKNKKEKKRKKRKKKRKMRKKREKKEKRKKGTMNSVKLLHIKCCISNFSIVRWHWKINFAPPRKSWNGAPGEERKGGTSRLYLHLCRYESQFAEYCQQFVAQTDATPPCVGDRSVTVDTDRPEVGEVDVAQRNVIVEIFDVRYETEWRRCLGFQFA